MIPLSVSPSRVILVIQQGFLVLRVLLFVAPKANVLVCPPGVPLWYPIRQRDDPFAACPVGANTAPARPDHCLLWGGRRGHSWCSTGIGHISVRGHSPLSLGALLSHTGRRSSLGVLWALRRVLTGGH